MTEGELVTMPSTEWSRRFFVLLDIFNPNVDLLIYLYLDNDVCREMGTVEL